MAGPVVTDDAEGHPPAGGEPQPPRDAPSGDATYPAQRQRLAYQPGFDGIRGVGLTFVMLSHFGVPWAKGGFFWVSTFFTLSGFLIMSLLIKEQEGNGRVSLSAFWSRRFRRLMPGAVITLLGVVVFGAVLADPSQLATLRTDGIAALFYVANWAFIIGDRNYADLFASPSPVQHFWTLSIEEQFYIVFPLLLIGLLVWGKRNWRVVAWALGGVTLVAAVWGVWLYAQGASVDRIYFGTDTRLPELTAGVLLAVVVHLWKPGDRPGTVRALQWLGIPALALILVMTVTVERTDSWLYRGGLPAYGLLSCLLIVSISVPGGWARRLLSFRALREIGMLSYGGYLFHWPLFLTFTPERMERFGVPLSGWSLFAFLFVLTMGLAYVSNRFFEHPIRIGERLTGRTPWIVAPASFALVVVGFMLVTLNPPPPEVNLGSDGSGSEWRPMPAAEEGKPRILIVGDSQAYVLGLGIERWDDRTGEAVVWSNALAGCGIVRGGEVNFPVDTTSCEDWDRRWSEAVAAFDPDVVVVMSGGWDWIERKLPEWDDFKFYGDPVFDQYLVDEYVEAVDVLSANGARIAWFDNACYELQDFGEDPTHMNEDLIPALQAQRPDVVDIIEFHDLVCPNGTFTKQLFGLDDARPDGTHLSDPASDIVADWLGPQLLELAAQGRVER